MMERRAGQPLPRRLAKVTYGKLLSPFAHIPQSIEVASNSYDLSTSGGQQIVFANESGVAKIIMGSLSFERGRTEGEVEGFQGNYDRAVPHMNGHLTETRFDLKRFRGGLYGAIALQPRVRADREFRDIYELVGYRDDEPYIGELESFSDSLATLYADTSLQIDINGARNIFLSGEEKPRLEVVDTIIVSPEMQVKIDHNRGIPTGETITEKMTILRDAVRVKPIALT
jgi:hypothetical protein